MSKQPILVLAPMAAVAAGNCQMGGFQIGDAKEAPPNSNATKISRSDPLTTTGRKTIVLSVHTKKDYPDACMLGMTLTNHLGIKVTNLSVRLTTDVRGDVQYTAITRNATAVKPTERRYGEGTFTQIKCSEIDDIGITDPDRCAIDEDMNRFTSTPGDCAKFVDVAVSPHITVRRTKPPKLEQVAEPLL